MSSRTPERSGRFATRRQRARFARFSRAFSAWTKERPWIVRLGREIALPPWLTARNRQGTRFFEWLCNGSRRIIARTKPLSDRIEEENELIDLNPRLAAFVYLVLASTGIAGVALAYPAQASYWIMIWGERGPRVESTLILFTSLVIFWIRQVLFPRVVNGPAITKTRNQYAFQGALLALFVVAWPLANLKLAPSYRHPEASYLYNFWLLTVFFYLAWAFEVAWAVHASYTQRELQKSVTHTSEILDLYERMRWDTQDLVWSMGTMAFFFLICYADFYLSLTWEISGVIVATILYISVWPWRGASKYATSLLLPRLTALEEDRERCYRKMRKVQFRSDLWREYKAEVDEVQAEIKRFNDMLEQFDFLLWLDQRRKDILPLAALNIVGALWRLPALDQLLRLFGKQ